MNAAQVAARATRLQILRRQIIQVFRAHTSGLNQHVADHATASKAP